MEKRVMSSEEFIDRFVECLEKGEDFRLEDCIVEGEVNILKIYERIKEKIKDEKRLKELITEQVDNFGQNIKTITINVNFHLFNVDFRGDFRLFCHINKNEIRITFSRNVNFRRVLFHGDVDFKYSTFEDSANFEILVFNGNANFMVSKFKTKVMFKNLIFRGYVDFRGSVFNEDFKENVGFIGEISPVVLKLFGSRSGNNVLI